MMNDYERLAGTVIGRTNIAAANAKEGGANIVIYDQSMKEQLLETIAERKPELLVTMGAGNIDRFVEPLQNMISQW